MAKSFFKKCISLILTLCIFCSILSTANLNISAADTVGVSVDIVSFMRGPQEDLRASELLEARVTGYSGNVQELTYEWINEIGTYLYIYNSHNMYHINNTDGELEIYNSKVSSSENMVGRSFKDKHAAKGFCWAAVYGAYDSPQTALDGQITVIVRDAEGNELCRDTHVAEVTSKRVSNGWFGYRYEYTYSGIIESSIQSDLDDVTIGMFVGDKRNVKDLLGESAILHITCVESDVQSGTIVGTTSPYIKLTKESDGDYYIEGIKAGTSASSSSTGDAQVNLTIKKGNCKFHQNKSGSATTTVFVFKKPTTSTTAYTLTLSDLDDRCEYFIDGRKGEYDETTNTVFFDGLQPNTQYMVEVRAKYTVQAEDQVEEQTRYAYAYVYDTTKPVYNGTVEVILDGEYDSATHTATGDRVDINQVSNYSELYAKEVNSDNFIKLDKVENKKGVYTHVLDNGDYHLYYENNKNSQIDKQYLTIHNADRTRYLFYNSVEYKSEGQLLDTEYYVSDSSVNVYDKIPEKEGYVFTGWKLENDESGKLYQPNELLTTNISQKLVLVAQWIEGVDVYVNIEIDHKYIKNGNTQTDPEDTKHNVSFDLMAKPAGAGGDYADVFTAPYPIDWNGTSEFKSTHFTAEYNKDENITYYKYITTAPLLENTSKDQDFSVEVAKSGYEIKSVTTTKIENSNDVVVNVKLQYEPKNADLKFTVKLDEEQVELINKNPEYKPKAVHVKILSWYEKAQDVNGHIIPANSWTHMLQHHDTFVTLTFDKDSTTASGSYPVWMHNNSKTNYFKYRIKVVSYVLQDGRVVETKDLETTLEDGTKTNNVEYISAGGRYTATVPAKNGGTSPNPEFTPLDGAYFDETGNQIGDLVATIHINTHTVTFDPNEGTLNGTTDKTVLKEQLKVPDLSQYVPVKEGGFVFDGWQVVKGEPPVGNDLFTDIEFQAVWKAPLTVEGTVSVPAHYHVDTNGDGINDDTRIIESVDRTHDVMVYLQKILPNGYAETVDSQKVHIAYDNMSLDEENGSMGTGSYSFTQVPNDGHEYRILVQNPNYDDRYQNEPKSLNTLNISKVEYYDPENSNSKSFMAVFGETDPLIATVNVFMEFTPVTFELNYSIDALAIGESYRPENADIAVLHNDNNAVNPQRWPVISDMIDNGKVEVPESTPITDGIGNESYNVWMNHADGHTMYEYSVLLNAYTAANEIDKTGFDEKVAPFYAYYSGRARYSAVNGQSAPLKITLVPKQYLVTFDVNFTESENDFVMGMDYYEEIDEDGKPYYTVQHTWSYDTDISKVAPVRPGYKFLGWYDKNPDENEDAQRITKINASVAENTTVYAKWDEAHTVIFHSNNPKADTDIFRTYYESTVTPPEGENNFKLTADGKVQKFYDIPEFEYMTHNGYIFKGWYLDYDSDTRPISFENDTYTKTTHIYAHWIKTGTVEKEEADTKITESGKQYPGFDLIGVQIRNVEKDNVDHYGEANTGLRFVTVLSESVYEQINALNKNASGTEYGYVLAKTDTAKAYHNKYGKPENYELQYNGTNVNGEDTSTFFKYVTNVKCSGKPDHYNGEAYRLFTTVVTYSGDESKVQKNHAAPLLARSYIRYTDANGLLRTHYNNYTGTNVFSGCSASFDDALALMNLNK